jgi:hypothetical protein
VFSKKKVQEVTEAIQENSPKSTLTLVKESYLPIDQDLEGRLHFEKVCLLTSRDNPYIGSTSIKILKENGFHWIVKSDFIKKFKHHAGVRGNQIVYDYDMLSYVTYVGDFPKHALENLEKAVELGVPYFTIHSMETIPVRFTSTFDPILIGWLVNPRINFFSGHPRDLDIRDTEGLIIAIWDTSKEIEL